MSQLLSEYSPLKMIPVLRKCGRWWYSNVAHQRLKHIRMGWLIYLEEILKINLLYYTIKLRFVCMYSRPLQTRVSAYCTISKPDFLPVVVWALWSYRLSFFGAAAGLRPTRTHTCSVTSIRRFERVPKSIERAPALGKKLYVTSILLSPLHSSWPFGMTWFLSY